MKIGYGCHYAQAKAVAWRCPALFEPVKTLKYFLAIRFGNARAVIGNSQFSLST
jgi:hypothetical protein